MNPTWLIFLFTATCVILVALAWFSKKVGGGIYLDYMIDRWISGTLVIFLILSMGAFISELAYQLRLLLGW